MKKVCMLLGVAAIIFGMSSCKKECNCTTSYNVYGTTYSTFSDWGEQTSSDCQNIQTAFKVSLGDDGYKFDCSED